MREIFYEFDADKSDYFWSWQFTKNYTPPHFHKSLEMIYCVKGSMTVFIDREYHTLHENQICFIPSYIVHSNKYQDDDNVIHSFLFAHNYFHDFEKSFPQKNIPYLLLNTEKNLSIYKDILKIFNIYAQYNYNGNNIPFLQKQALINEILLKLTETYPLVTSSESKENETIIEILKFINENYKEDLNLSKIAKKFHYSTKYFSDYFTRNVGCPFTKYLHNVRIKNILYQKENSDNKQSIAQLAFGNGFNSLPTFYRVLKQYKKIHRAR